jgi:hypothetical protein
VRCLQLSRSGDLWFGPQLQLALEGASPSSSSDFLLLPWIISNCSRRVPSIFATTSATRPRTRPLDDHTLAVMRSLMRFVARLLPLFLASAFVLGTGTCAVFWIPHAYYGRMCSGETAHWLQRCGGANCSVDTPHAFCSLDAAAAALQPFVAATPGQCTPSVYQNSEVTAAADATRYHGHRDEQHVQHMSVATSIHISSAALSVVSVTHDLRGAARDLR